MSNIDANIKNTSFCENKKKHKWSPYEIIGLVIFSMYAFSLIFSLLWAFTNSLKTRMEYLGSVVALPKHWLFSNYIEAFNVLSASNKNAFVLLFNSIWLSVLGPTISIATAAMASYVMSKYKFPGRDIIWGIMITVMIIPIYGSTASTFKMYQTLHLYNSPLILITKIASIGGNMMMIAAFDGVSKTYMEAAFLEGAGHFRIFVKIMLPQVSGLLAALWIMGFIGEWNNYMGPIMFLPDFPTLSSGLYIYQMEQGRHLNTPILFAGTFICILPVITLFAVFSDKFLNLSYGSGIKG